MFLTCLLRDFPIWTIENAENLFCFFYCLKMWMKWGKIQLQEVKFTSSSCSGTILLPVLWSQFCAAGVLPNLENNFKFFTHNVYISGGSILGSGSRYCRFLTKVLVLRTNSIKSVRCEKRVATIYFVYRIFEIFFMH